MSQTKEISISSPLRDMVTTGAITGTVTMRPPSDSYYAGWQAVIDRLLAWLRDPSSIDDDDCTPPGGMIIRSALDLSEEYQRLGYPPPTSVVPDPNGGIVFELATGSESQVMHLWNDGTAEFLRFSGSQLLERRRMTF